MLALLTNAARTVLNSLFPELWHLDRFLKRNQTKGLHQLPHQVISKYPTNWRSSGRKSSHFLRALDYQEFGDLQIEGEMVLDVNVGRVARVAGLPRNCDLRTPSSVRLAFRNSQI
jgi:hypothetical protein